jgi:hypothetical protein
MGIPICPFTKQIIRYPSSHGNHFFETEPLQQALQKKEACPVCQHSIDSIQLYDCRYFDELRKYSIAHMNARITYDFYVQGQKVRFLDKHTIDVLQRNCEIKSSIHKISQKIVKNLFPVLSISTIILSSIIGKIGAPISASATGRNLSIIASITGILLAPFSMKTDPLAPEDEMKARIKRASIIGVGLGTAIGLCGIKIAHLFGSQWSILAALIGGPVAIGLGQTLATSKIALLKPLSGLYIGTATIATTYIGSLLIRSISVVKDNVLLSIVKGILAGGLSHSGTSMITASIAKGQFTPAFTGSLCMTLATFTGHKTAIIVHSLHGILSAVGNVKPTWNKVMEKCQEKIAKKVEQALVEPTYLFFLKKTTSE